MTTSLTQAGRLPLFYIALYLDFDGVLHDDEIYWSRKRGIYGRTPGMTLFQWNEILARLLAPYPEVKIVLSTSWVRVKSFNYAKYKLPPSLQERVIGATFHRREMRADEFAQMQRGHQVLGDVSRRCPPFWMAIDDDAEGWPERHADNVILTQPATGISTPEVQAKIVEVIERGLALASERLSEPPTDAQTTRPRLRP